MNSKIIELKSRYEELQKLLSDPKVFQDRNHYAKLSKEFSALKEILSLASECDKIKNALEDNEHLLNEETDEEMKALAMEESLRLKKELEDSQIRLKLLIMPKDPKDNKNVILEIRAGTGGAEAALFSADLFKVYTRYAESAGWSYEVLSSAVSDLGGYREVIVLLVGQGVYGDLKYESGVHRVQRVPETETQGRIHTSTVTVAVLPEADEVEIDINPKDLKVDVFRSSGPGGQSVNTTDSAVRVTHIPSGLVVTCQDEKSQHKNKAKALKILRARLLEHKIEEQEKEQALARKKQVGSADRSERIRTYNFPQNRVTDHRIGLTLKKLDQVMQGKISEIIEALKIQGQKQD
ncbi:MAG: peptide chain release factor 1 [Deltaproteobacteria bacterium]|nr:peptide chain release factor 1 [Deltaproteobacteria bacterium]